MAFRPFVRFMPRRSARRHGAAQASPRALKGSLLKLASSDFDVDADGGVDVDVDVMRCQKESCAIYRVRTSIVETLLAAVVY